MAHSSLDRFPDEWVIVNCASCDCVALVDPSPKPEGCRAKVYGGRLKGRPYCTDCLTFPDGKPDDRSRSSDFNRSIGQLTKTKSIKEFFS